MTILSWNVCLPPWSPTRKQRIQKIITVIANSSADVICLQEVFFKADADAITASLREFGFTESFHFKDLLIVSRLKLDTRWGRVFADQGKFLSFAILDKLYGKGYQFVRIKQLGIALINTHLLSAWALASDRYQVPRQKQLKEICQALSNLAGKSKLVVGDLNFQPGTSAHKTMRSFVDLTPNLTTQGKGQLDYIFAKNIQIIGKPKLIYNKQISDHAALIISVKIT